MEKDKALFIGFYFWCGYHKQSLWEEFDKVYRLADKFVQTYAKIKSGEKKVLKSIWTSSLESILLNSICTQKCI